MQEEGQLSNIINILRNQYSCNYTRNVMRNPVIDCEGISYEKDDIEMWLQNNDVSPVTGNQLQSKNLIRNQTLQQLINKIETYVPSLCSGNKLLKNQVLQLKLQNERLRELLQFKMPNQEQSYVAKNQIEKINNFYPMPQNQIMRKTSQELVTEKKQITSSKETDVPENKKTLETSHSSTVKLEQHSRKKIRKQNKEKIVIILDSQEEEETIKELKLQKQKFIKKNRIQFHDDSLMKRLLKKEKIELINHIQNIDVKYALATQNYTRQINEKDQKISVLKDLQYSQNTFKTELRRMVFNSQKSEDNQEKIVNLLKNYIQSNSNIERNSLLNHVRCQRQILSLKKERNELIKKIQTLQPNIMHQGQNHQQKQFENISYHRMLERQNFQNQMKQMATKLEEQKAKLSQQISELCEKNSSLEARINHLKEEIAKLYQQNTRQEQNNKNLQQQIANLQRQHPKLEIQMSWYQKQNKRLTKLNQNMQQQKEWAQNQIGRAKASKYILQGQIQTIKIQTKKEKTLAECCEKDLQLKNKQLRKKIKEDKHLIALNKKLEEDNKMLRQQNQTFSQKNESIQKSLEQATIDHSTQIKRQKEQKDKLSAQLGNIHMIWMFIFFIYESVIAEHDEVQEGKIIQPMGRQKQQNPTDVVNSSNSETNLDHKLNDKMDEQVVNFDIIPDKECQEELEDKKVLGSVINQQKKCNQGSINKQQMINQNENYNQIINRQISHQPNQINSQQRDRNQKMGLIKKRVSQKMQQLDDLLSQTVKNYEQINSQTIKKAKDFYRKITLLFKSISNQPPHNFWNIYKICRQIHKVEIIGQKYQINCVSLLNILIRDKQIDLQWQDVSCIKSKDTSLDDESWTSLIKHSHLYQNVVEIDLENNRIQNITKKDLEKWKKLTKINLSKNPLSKESMHQLNQYSRQNPNVIVRFTLCFF